MLNKNKKNVILLVLILLFTYNVVLFVLCGFNDHGATFWCSYIFMLIAFGMLSVSGYLIRNFDMKPTDWLLGYPVLKHCVRYILFQLLVSSLFVFLDYKDFPVAVAFSVQMILLAVHLIFIISCFVAKEKIEEIQIEFKDKTSKLRLLQVDVEMIVENATDTEIKELYNKLAEEMKYSDPIGNDSLYELENQISNILVQANNSIINNDKNETIRLCQKASALLQERNRKCKALKRCSEP